MGESLRIVHDNSWKTVEAPYIFHEDGWKTVHKVWVMNGGSWKESHKTDHSKYTLGSSGGISTTTNSGTWTVPANTRYARVTVIGNGGGGGAANRTNSFYDKTASPNSGNPPWTKYTLTANGGDGGAGGSAIAIVEVRPGETYTYTVGQKGYGGARSDSLPNSNQTQGESRFGNLNLRNDNIYSDRSEEPPQAATWNPPWLTETDVDTAMNGYAGQTAEDITFSGNGQTVKATGGAGGNGGRLFVYSWTRWQYNFGWTDNSEIMVKYTVHVNTGGGGNNGTSGSGIATGSNIISSTLTTGGGASGGSKGTASATSADGGSHGDRGSIQIETYQGM